MKFIVTGLSFLICLVAFTQTKLQVDSDTIRIVNGELVIKNNTQGISGYLFNIGNGVTEFRPANLQNSKGIQFRVGTAGYPVAGDFNYINAGLSGRQLNVWRNGIFQYKDSVDGVLIDSIAGKVSFNPALSTGERIYIESIGIDMLQNNIFGFFTNLVKLNAGVCDNNDFTYTLRWATNQKTLLQKPRVLGLGSSTLAGYGVAAPNRLGDKIGAWLNVNTTAPVWRNLAVGGYYSANLLPAGMSGSQAGHNIDSAVRANADFIFVSLPSNDPSAGLTPAQTMSNLRVIDTVAANRGIPVFFETTQPRSSYGASDQTALKVLADSIRKAWPSRFVEGFNDVVNSSAPTDAVIRTEYDNGDGVHLNSAGNQFIADRLFARWNDYFKPITGVSKYIIQTSTDLSNWTNFDVILGSDSVKKDYSRIDNITRYFRVQAVYTNGQPSAFSNITKLDTLALNFTGKGSRILIDLGGDNVYTKNGSNLPDGKPVPITGYAGNYWNNWYGENNTDKGFVAGSALSALKATNGIPTAVSIKLLTSPYGTYTSTPTNGLNFVGIAGNVMPDYPMEAVVDNMFLNSSINPNGTTLRIKGLNSAKKYRIKLWGARLDNSSTPRILETKLGSEGWEVAQNSDTRYGTSSPGDYENANIHEITGVDSVDINARVGAGSTFSHISVIDIDTVALSGGGNPVITLNNLNTTVGQSEVITPVITTNGATITTYAWTKVSGPSNLTISNTAIAAPTFSNFTNGVFVYKLTITTSTLATVSQNITLTAFPDNEGKKTLRAFFSLTQRGTIPGWFNVFGSPSAAVISKLDTTTSWTISNQATGASYWNPFSGNALDDGGQWTSDNSGVVPDLVLRNLWFNAAKQFVSGTNNLIITGLNPAKTYNISIVGSRNSSAGAPRSTAWHVNNGSEILSAASGNTTAKGTATSIAPDSFGKIVIGIYSPANTTTNGDYSYLNALIIQEN